MRAGEDQPAGEGGPGRLVERRALGDLEAQLVVGVVDGKREHPAPVTTKVVGHRGVGVDGEPGTVVGGDRARHLWSGVSVTKSGS